MIDNFIFDSPPSPSGARIVEIRDGIQSKQDLMDELNSKLNLPPYFGRNWDALSEVLRDLSWIPEREVLVIHRDLPRLDHDSLVHYLDVLSDAIADWSLDEDHELTVVFPSSSRPSISRILSEGHAASGHGA